MLVPVRDTSKTRSYSTEARTAKPFLLSFNECSCDENSIIASGRNVDILYVRGIEIKRKVIEGLRNCKLIVSGSVGLDNLDVDVASQHGIAVVNVPDLFTREVAEHAVAQILSSYKKLVHLDRLVRNGCWAEGHRLSANTPPLSSATLGLVGFGRIAQAVATTMSTFGTKVIASDPHVPTSVFSSFGVNLVDLETVASQSDIVSVHVPSTSETVRLIDSHFLSLMRRTAILVNTGRGSTIDELALFQALDQRLLAGAALDVFNSEPLLQSSPLLSLSNVLVTPHIASITAEFEPKRKLRIGREIKSFLSGERPMNCVNWEELS